MPGAHAVRRKLREAVTRYGIDNERVDIVRNLPKLRTWQRGRVPVSVPRFENRLRFYDHLQEAVLADEPMDYLEMGVYKGESLSYWSEIHKNPESRFWGFDSFEGLPESWRYVGGVIDSSTFDTGGRPPEIDDDRIEFVTGMFQDSVPGFVEKFRPRSRLVLHCDADLYSSTLYALTQFDRFLVPGSVVLFDEFASVMDEFAALRDYCAAYRRDYDVIAYTDRFMQVAITMR